MSDTASIKQPTNEIAGELGTILVELLDEQDIVGAICVNEAPEGAAEDCYRRLQDTADRVRILLGRALAQ